MFFMFIYLASRISKHCNFSRKESLINFFLQLQACAVNLTQPSGEITSYGFPLAYYREMDCTWLIQRLQGEIIEISFTYFDVQPDNVDQNCL